MISVFSILLTLSAIVDPNQAVEHRYALNAYGGIMTANSWEELLVPLSVDYERSYLGAVTLAKRLGHYRNKVTFEVEGQVVKHFEAQNHWELNALVTGRWEPFYWDKFLDTSLAFGIGPSYATEKPIVETANDGDTSRWLVYWMIELAFNLPQHKRTALITRIHHRSNAFGLIAEKGGSNAVAMGLKVRF